MTSIERVMAAVRGDKKDFIPYTLLCSLYGSSFLKCDSETYYSNPEIWFEGQINIIKAFDPDILIAPFSFPIEAAAFGVDLIYFHKYAPNVKKPIISDLTQIKKLRLPDLNTNPYTKYFIEGTKLMSHSYKSTKAIGAPIHSPCDLPALLMGIEMWIDTLLFNQWAVMQILGKTTEHFINMGNELLDNGATFLIVPVNFTNPMIITQTIFDRLFPHLENAFSQIKGPIVIHNGGCILKTFLDKFSQLPNVIAVLVDPRESLDESRKILGDKMVLMGNLDGPNLNNLSPDAAHKKTLKILENRKSDPHFIFASSNADIPYDTPRETINAVIETIRNFKSD